MPRKKTTPTPNNASLEVAVREIAENLAKLTTRLVGDEALQTKGLIHEFAECRSLCQQRADASAKTQSDLGEAIRLLVARMEAVEAFKQKQEAVNQEVSAFIKDIESKENKFLGGWKTITMLVTAIAPLSGLIGWLLAHLQGK